MDHQWRPGRPRAGNTNSEPSLRVSDIFDPRDGGIRWQDEFAGWAMATCGRYDFQGNHCRNSALYADGWCRSDGCPGFLRRSIKEAPEPTRGKFPVSKKTVRTTRSIPANLRADPRTIKIDGVAVNDFLARHGGNKDVAISQIREMLTDFLDRAAREVSKTGSLALSLEGYRLRINPERNRITGYSTVHRERTWQQIKAGVPSRIGIREVDRTATPPNPTISKPEPALSPEGDDRVFATPRPKPPKPSDEELDSTGSRNLAANSATPQIKHPADFPRSDPPGKQTVQESPMRNAKNQKNQRLGGIANPERSLSNRPLRTIGIAAVAGFALGRLSRFRRGS